MVVDMAIVMLVVLGGIIVDENENKIDITQYIERFYITLRKMKKVVVVIVLLTTLFFEAKTLFGFDIVYSSQAIYLPSRSNDSNIFTTVDGENELVSTFNSVISGEMMRDVIKEKLEIDTVPAQIQTIAIPETNLVTLKVSASDPQMAYDVITCILDNYSLVTSQMMSDVTMNVFDIPQLASEPDALPNYFKSGLKGMIYGVVIAFVVLLIRMLSTHTINSSEDVEKMLHLNNLAKIPLVPTLGKSQLLLTNPRIQYGVVQAFHDLRIKIEQENKKNHRQVFMFTSTAPNEGKSTVSTNVAITLAQHNHSVVLVDLDLRNPSILKTLGVKSIKNSVVGYLQGYISLNEVTNHYMDNFDFICTDEPFAQASECLGLETFAQMIAQLRIKYDYVILDVPPLFMMEDALVVARQADSAAIVIKQDYANTYDVLEALEELNGQVPHITGTILNQVKPSLFETVSKGYGYGYGYGYGSRKG